MSASAPPLKVVIGWIDTNSKKDAIEYAKGYALRHLDAPEIGWYAVMSFLGGHLYEVQEGGSGDSYLSSVVRSLAKGVDPAWFRVGLRAFSVSLRDGRPYCILLPKEDSQKLFALASNEIQPSGRMNHVVQKGKALMAVGLSIFATGFAFFLGNAVFYVALLAATPEPRSVDQEKLPYRQWSKVERVSPTMYVEALRFKDGQWAASIKPMQTARAGSSDAPTKAPKVAVPTGASVAPSGSQARTPPVANGSLPAAPRPVPVQAPSPSTSLRPMPPTLRAVAPPVEQTPAAVLPALPPRPLIPNASPVATPMNPTPIRRDGPPPAPPTPPLTSASAKPVMQIPSILPSLESATSLARPAPANQPPRGAQ